MKQLLLSAFFITMFSFHIMGQEILDPSKVSISIKQHYNSLSLKSSPSVSITVINLSEESFDQVSLSCEHFDMDQNLLELIDDIDMTDPNGNGILEPDEKWIATQVIDNNALSSILGVGLIASNSEHSYITADACLLRNVGMNMEVHFEADGAEPGEIVDVEFRVRLIISEDVAKEITSITICVNGVPIETPLARFRVEARDVLIGIDGYHNDDLFSATEIPDDVPLVPLCDQEGLDLGRNIDGVLDECEDINTVRPPCFDFDENDSLCEFPDWVFCMPVQIPEEVEGDYWTLTAIDSVQLFFSEEDPPHSGEYMEFMDITEMTTTRTIDTDTIQILNVSSEDIFDQDDYNIAPNPFSEQLQVFGPGVVWVDIFDNSGRQHLSESSSNLSSRNLSHLPTGFYFAVIKDKEGGKMIGYERLIKQ